MFLIESVRQNILLLIFCLGILHAGKKWIGTTVGNNDLYHRNELVKKRNDSGLMFTTNRTDVVGGGCE